MQLLEPMEAISPRRAQGYGEHVRHAAALLRAGLPVPSGYALSRSEADTVYARVLAPEERPLVLLDPHFALPSEAALAELQARVRAAAVTPDLAAELDEVFGKLRGQGAPALVLTGALVCDKPREERVLGDVQLGIDSDVRLRACVADAFASLFEPALLRSLRAVDVRDASVALCIQRMVDGMVSGVAYTRHPITGDAHEWLVRSGYGLASAVRLGQVPSDVFRLSRDGYTRDRVVVAKQRLLLATADGKRELRETPRALATSASLTDAGVREVTRLAERTERHLGTPVRIEWAIAQSKLYLLRADAVPGPAKIPRTRSLKPEQRARELWSHAELGEALPHVLSPLAWSLLRRFNRAGLSSTLSAAGVALGASYELLTDVRGRPYLNLGALTSAVCRLPGVNAAALARVGIDVGPEPSAPDTAGPVDLVRAAARLYDSHVRFGVRLGILSRQTADERGHFAGLDARLLAPDAVERVLCDVELFVRDVGTALMRAYGVWLAILVAFRSLLVGRLGDDALRLERDLLWGPGELIAAQSGHDFLAAGRALARDPSVLAWVDQGGSAPEIVRSELEDLALRHRHDGMLLLDPQSPRWRETPQRLEGAMRALLADPMGVAFASERNEIARGRRERAEREWKRKLPLPLWPLVQLSITRLRELTRQRESLLSDLTQGIGVVREIAVDVSRRLSMRHRDLGSDAAFFLELDELHAALARSQWEVQERVRVRRVEYGLVSALPPAVARFQGRPADEHSNGEPVRGVAGSGGAAEGRIFAVRDGSELARLPPGAVLLVSACDVGLGTVLPAVRAVISEQGGMVSHGAMLASALGVPVVVGVPNALERFSDGERVRVDADQNVIEHLGSAR